MESDGDRSLEEKLESRKIKKHREEDSDGGGEKEPERLQYKVMVITMDGSLRSL